jgi:hypothetical protein
MYAVKTAYNRWVLAGPAEVIWAAKYYVLYYGQTNHGNLTSFVIR